MVDAPGGRHALYLRAEARCGLDTMSEFFARLHLATQVGCSAPLTRGDAGVGDRAAGDGGGWEQDGHATGEVREIIGAVDERSWNA